MKLTDFVNAKAIVPQLASRDRDGAIEELVQSLVGAGAITASLHDDLVKEILAREKKGSTGFGKGVAVPHVKHERIKKMTAAIGISPHGVDFNALDREPVYSIVLLLSPKDQAEQHLQAMESIFSYLQKEMFRRFLRQADSARAVFDLLEEADAQKFHA